MQASGKQRALKPLSTNQRAVSNKQAGVQQASPCPTNKWEDDWEERKSVGDNKWDEDKGVYWRSSAESGKWVDWEEDGSPPIINNSSQFQLPTNQSNSNHHTISECHPSTSKAQPSTRNVNNKAQASTRNIDDD